MFLSSSQFGPEHVRELIDVFEPGRRIFNIVSGALSTPPITF